MSKSDTGRKARQNGAAFERQIARDLREWLGPEWAVARLKTSYQAEAGGEFEIEWVGGLEQHWQVPIDGGVVGVPDAKTAAEALELAPGILEAALRSVGRLRLLKPQPTGAPFLVPPVPVFPVALELKRDASFRTDQLWKPGVSAAFRVFWSQAVEQAEAVGKRPWLVLREPPRGPVLLVMRREDWVSLNGAIARDGVPVLRFAGLVALPWGAFLDAVPASALAELS